MAGRFSMLSSKVAYSSSRESQTTSSQVNKSSDARNPHSLWRLSRFASNEGRVKSSLFFLAPDGSILGKEESVNKYKVNPLTAYRF